MRLVQVPIPTGRREAVLSALDDEGVDYVVTEESSGREYAAVVTFPLPTAAVEPVLERLREAGIERDSYTVVVGAETVVSRRFDRLAEEYAEQTDESRIAREELLARAEELAPSVSTYVLLTVVSVVVATAGLLLDSPAVVVGSMVIAPLVGPAMAASVGSVLGEPDLFRRGIYLQAGGLAVAVLAATAFSLLVQVTALVPPGLDVTAVPEVRERILPDFLALVVALGAGVAGAASLRSGVSTSLVGVTIAVALVPPTAVVGIGIAWGLPSVVAGAAVLVAVNVLSINLAALATLWYSGYRPERWFDLADARRATLRRIAVLAVVVALLSVVLGGVTLVSYQQALTREAVEDRVGETVDRTEGLELLEVEVEFAPIQRRVDDPLRTEVRSVVVTVGRSGGDHPRLADRIATAVADRAPGATVEVRFVDVDRSRAERSRLRPRRSVRRPAERPGGRVPAVGPVAG